MKTTRQAIVIETTLEDIENSEHLALGKFNGYQVVTNKHSWKIQPSYPKILAIHIPPESLVDSSREEFKFLAKEGKDRWQTVKTCKLRGVLSEGCFIPPLPDMIVGQDVTELFDVRHVEDEPENNEIVSAKPLNSIVRNLHKYDVDSAKNFYKELTQEDEVVATVKVHGCLHEDSLIDTYESITLGEPRKSIKDIKIGDIVSCYDFDQSKMTFGEVENVLVRSRTEMLEWYEFELANGEKLVCTEDHLILTYDGWKQAKDITIHDTLV